MLTSKQIKELPKGEYTNADLHRIYSNHGKKNRLQVMRKTDGSGKEFKFVTGMANRRQTRQGFKFM
jgi:hypothetical protein